MSDWEKYGTCPKCHRTMHDPVLCGQCGDIRNFVMDSTGQNLQRAMAADIGLVPHDHSVCPDNPEWAKAGKVHDWRNHVPEPVRAIWEHLQPVAKQAIYYMAVEIAGQEEWE